MPNTLGRVLAAPATMETASSLPPPVILELATSGASMINANRRIIAVRIIKTANMPGRALRIVASCIST